ncbi:MAG: hypothetical protein HOQ22_12835, partial [Nocardioidaceae bacterium]|nr:hypothetical protein [Nocardioidaceae bacterium]
MLVRRSVVERLGFDRRLPLYGNDIDFGWRAARADHRALVVPDAVVFHAEAAHRGVRESRLAGHHRRRAERAAALYTLLVNCSAAALPFQLVRLFLGSLIRAFGMLLVRAPGEALDELAGLGRAYLHPLRIISGRRSRRRTSTLRAREVRHLLAPPWVPYRHGLDFVGDLAAAVINQASDISAARRARADAARAAAIDTGPVAAEAQNLPADTGLVVRLLTSRLVWLITALTVLALVAARGLYGAGMLSGGGLLPAPSTSMDWWRLYVDDWHPMGVGSSVPTAPYVLPLALAGSVLLGKAWLVVDLLFLLAVPLCALGAYRFLARLTSSPVTSLWGALAYAVLPVALGAVQQGRLGTVAAAVLLPWLAHSAIFLGSSYSDDRRTRAAWRTAMWLGLVVAFVPLAWVMALVVGVVAVVARVRSGRGRHVGEVLVPLIGSLFLLLPWTLSTWSHRGLSSWLFEAGLPAPAITEPLSRLDVLFGRQGAGAPALLTIGLLVAAVAALLRPDTRRDVLKAWVVVLVGLGVTVTLAGGRYSLPNAPTDQPLWLGFPLLVVQAAGITAAAIAGTGIRRRLSTSSFGWRQPFGVLVVLVAALTPVVVAGWWVWEGTAGAVDRRPVASVPTYMSDAAKDDPVNGSLVVRGSRATGFEYVVLRQPGIRLGDDSVEPSAADQAGLTSYVTDLVTAPDPRVVAGLAQTGVAYVYAPAPADIGLVGNLDSVSGVSSASAVRPGARAWQLDAKPTDDKMLLAVDQARPWLLAAQGLAVLVVLVLAAPSRGERR